MIKLLARLFRGIHYVVGISAPPPGTSDGKLVLAWLVGLGFVAAIFVLLVLTIPVLYFRR
jgi:hypothetical protein